MTSFHLIDLVSQREAVREHLKGWPADDMLAWIGARGELTKFRAFDRDCYIFESTLGFRAHFFFDGDDIIFLGDHTTFR